MNTPTKTTPMKRQATDSPTAADATTPTGTPVKTPAVTPQPMQKKYKAGDKPEGVIRQAQISFPVTQIASDEDE